MNSLFGLFERRSLENPTYPLTSQALIDYVGGPGTSAGIAVSPKRSLTMAAVLRCVTLISSVSSSLPLKTYRKGTREEVASLLLDNPHPDLTPLELWRLTYVHRCLWGNAYLQKVRDRGGRLNWLYPISPDRVKVGRVKYSAANPAGKIFEVTAEDGSRDAYTSDEIFHLPGLGYDGITGCSPIRLAAQGIGLGLAAEEYGARLFGSGSLLSGILQSDQRLTEEQATAVKARWMAKLTGPTRSHEIAVLDRNLKFQSVTMPNVDAQFLESRQFQTAEVGRIFGVPAFLLGLTEKSTSWGTGLEQQATGWVVFDLNPQWLAPTEQRITKELTASNVYAKYSVQGLLRGDSTARAAYYRVMREVGAFNADDIREKEDLPPIPDGKGQQYLQPLNLQPLGSDDENDAPSTDQNEDEEEDDE